MHISKTVDLHKIFLMQTGTQLMKRTKILIENEILKAQICEKNNT